MEVEQAIRQEVRTLVANLQDKQLDWQVSTPASGS